MILKKQQVSIVIPLSVAFTVLFASIAPAQSYLFNRLDFTTGTAPTAVATGDFRGIGALDLAVANGTDGTVSVLLSTTAGKFNDRVDYPAGAGPVAVATADFNGDKKLDLAVVDFGGNAVSILLGNGDGTFQPALTTHTGSQPTAVAMGDFNGDTRLDLAVTNSADNTVSILLGNGDGTFTLKMTVQVGLAPLSVAVGDLNGDGRLDLAVANSGDSTVSVLVGAGDGTFAAKPNLSVLSAPSSVALGDFNGDGRVDIAVVNSGIDITSGSPVDAVSVLLGNGDGTFLKAVNYGTGLTPVWLSVNDFNGDGKPDLAVVNNGGNTVSIILGNGDGSFQASSEYGVGTTPLRVAAGDFNGDGRLDVAVANHGSNNVSVLLGDGDGTLSLRNNYAAGAEPTAIVTGDFNADGKADFAVVDSNCFNPPCPVGSVSVFLGNHDGTFQSKQTVNVGTFPVSIASGDFNGDTKLDFAVVNQFSTTVSILQGKGDGTFTVTATYPTGNGPSFVAVDDFNRDGKLDLAITNSNDNTLSIFFGNGDGTFQAHVDYATGSGPTAVTAGDFNLDGKEDLAVANQSGTVSVLLGVGDGTFRNHVEYVTGLDSVAVVVRDFNRDHKPDLAVANAGSGTVSILLGLGDGTFQNQVAYDTGGAAGAMIAADVNHDGLQDLAVAEPGGGISLLLGDGDGTFQLPVGYAAGSSPLAVAAADFTGSGAMDLVASNSVSNTVSVLLNHPLIAVYPTSLNFGNQAVGVTSSPLTATLTNLTNQMLTVFGITATNGYSETNTCGKSIVAASSCTVSVSFTPVFAGTQTGTITISDSSPGSPQLIRLTGVGTGTGPAVTFFPTAINFGDEPVGKTSSVQTVSITNSGNAALTIAGIATTGDYAETNTCGSPLAAGDACAVSVTFSPKAGGTRTGTVSIKDNAPNSPQTVTLAGIGTGANPAVTLAPSSVSFSDLQVVGTTSPGQVITLTNTGLTTLTISSLVASANFGETSGCGSSLGVGASCTINAVFKPATFGHLNGTVTITDNAPNSPQTASLSGTATYARLVPTSGTFETQLIGTTSAPKIITLTNVGPNTMQINQISIAGGAPGEFSQTNNCGTSLISGGSCTVSVTFSPAARGLRTASVAIADTGGGSPQNVALTGTGTVVEVSPIGLIFGNQKVGTTSGPKTITLTNTASTLLGITSVSIVGTNAGDFAQTNTCGSGVPAGGSCTISVTFTPTAAGSRSASVSVSDNGGDSPQTVTVIGTGT